MALGANTLYSEEEMSYDVDEKFIHPDFVLDPWLGLPNDIMIMKLKESVDLTHPNISLIGLPSGGEDFMGAECQVSGWGAIKFTPWLRPHEVLQEADANPVSKDACIAAFDPDSITDLQICTIHDKSTPCAGDSGGPLVCKVEKDWLQAGVVSWGEDCRTDLPAVFTRVSEYNDWISSIIKDN